MNLRGAWRLAGFGWEICRTAFAVLVSSEPRGKILRRASRRILDRFGVRLEIEGPVPSSGLLVCNHLSYLDVLAIGAAAPARFVAKSEVRRWPLIGWLAARTGTIFVDRERPLAAARSAAEIDAALRSGELVVLFPEGTSSGGETVLPFKSSLLQPGTGRPVHAAALAFELEPGDGDAAEEVCYWKDMTLLPHLVRLLGKRSIRARLAFSPGSEVGTDRKDLAQRLHESVRELHRELREPGRRVVALRPS